MMMQICVGSGTMFRVCSAHGVALHRCGQGKQTQSILGHSKVTAGREQFVRTVRC